MCVSTCMYVGVCMYICDMCVCTCTCHSIVSQGYKNGTDSGEKLLYNIQLPSFPRSAICNTCFPCWVAAVTARSPPGLPWPTTDTLQWVLCIAKVEEGFCGLRALLARVYANLIQARVF